MCDINCVRDVKHVSMRFAASVIKTVRFIPIILFSGIKSATGFRRTKPTLVRIVLLAGH